MLKTLHKNKILISVCLILFISANALADLNEIQLTLRRLKLLNFSIKEKFNPTPDAISNLSRKITDLLKSGTENSSPLSPKELMKIIITSEDYLTQIALQIEPSSPNAHHSLAHLELMTEKIDELVILIKTEEASSAQTVTRISEHPKFLAELENHSLKRAKLRELLPHFEANLSTKKLVHEAYKKNVQKELYAKERRISQQTEKIKELNEKLTRSQIKEQRLLKAGAAISTLTAFGLGIIGTKLYENHYSTSDWKPSDNGGSAR